MLKPRGFLIADNSVLVKDYKNRNEKLLLLQKYSRYIICVLLLAHYPNIDKISPGESIAINMFIDDETTKS
jgi:hypothetical protein